MDLVHIVPNSPRSDPSGAAHESGDELVVPLPKGVDPSAVSSVVEAIGKAMEVLFSGPHSPASGVVDRADKIAEIATRVLEPNLELIEERKRRMSTIAKIVSEGDWLTAEQLNSLQDPPPANKSYPASDWKRRGRVFSVSYRGKELFPRYQFDSTYQPLPVIKEVLAAYGEVADTWKLAAWFHFPNGWLGETGSQGMVPLAPKDALDQGQAVVHAARKRFSSYVA